MPHFWISLYIGTILHINTIYGLENDCECGTIWPFTNPKVVFYNDTDGYRTGLCNGVRLSRYHILTSKSCFDLSNLAFVN